MSLELDKILTVEIVWSKTINCYSIIEIFFISRLFGQKSIWNEKFAVFRLFQLLISFDSAFIISILIKRPFNIGQTID